MGPASFTSASKLQDETPPLPEGIDEETSQVHTPSAVEEPDDGNILARSEELNSIGSEGTVTSSSSPDMSSDASPDAEREFSSQKEQILERLM
jgi:hypothetical protein